MLKIPQCKQSTLEVESSVLLTFSINLLNISLKCSFDIKMKTGDVRHILSVSLLCINVNGSPATSSALHARHMTQHHQVMKIKCTC